MKRILLSITVAASLAACTSNPPMGNQGTATQGTTMGTDTTGLAAFQSWKKYEADKPAVSYAVRNNSSSSGTARKTISRKTERATTETSYPAKPAKKGWSKAAKGAAIGGASGAVIGAVLVKKNRVAGGVVGGAVGAGVGYGIGRHMDKKDGRY
ncbi:MAG TPA: glycine zipper domain-containing protein [Flavitalea sp.]|nr:glycine zipper domain-containing protein [Flavitalea sp.]